MQPVFADFICKDSYNYEIIGEFAANFTIVYEKKIILATAAVFTAVVNIQAQKSPVGIVSVQDSVKSVQLGIISSVAADGGHGLG